MADQSEAELVQRLKKDDPDAWTIFVDRYAELLREFVHRRLPHGLRARVDADDVVQEVFRSVVVRVRRGDFVSDGEGRLWQILCIRAVKPLRGELRRHRAMRKDYHREEHSARSIGRDGHGIVEPADSHAGPDEIVCSRDGLLALMHKLDLRSQVVVHLRLDNYTLDEVAELMGCSVRTMKRLWEGACKRCQQLAHIPISSF